MYLRCSKYAGRFALGSACEKTQTDKPTIPFAEPAHHLCKADPVRKCFLRGVDGHIEFLQTVLIIGGGQAQGRQRGSEGDLLRGRAQCFCQFGDARLLTGTLQTALPLLIDLQRQLLERAAYLDCAAVPEQLFDLAQNDRYGVGGKANAAAGVKSIAGLDQTQTARSV